jgi:transposase InsO family protein
MAYVAFVIDAYSRRILGWRATTMRAARETDVRLECQQMLAYTRWHLAKEES